MLTPPSPPVDLHQAAALEAAKHGAIFSGPGATYKCGLFTLNDGRTVELPLYQVRDGKWPADIDQFLQRQASSRGRAGERMLTRLAELAEGGEAVLLDSAWHGPHYWYSFRLTDDREIKIRGSKLMTSGWPADVDAYLSWSAARCKGDDQPKSHTELFDEFKQSVSAQGAVVVATHWLGSKIPHEVLLSDGTVRKIKPNQIKYFGWPLVPLDELRKLAAPFPVHILPDTAHSGSQVFRLVLRGGVYLEGGFADLKAHWAAGAQEQVAVAAAWADAQGLVLLPARWNGMLAEYAFRAQGGGLVRHYLPCSAEAFIRIEHTRELAKLRRIGSLHKARLVSDTFQGKDAEYSWEREGEVFPATSTQLISRSAHQAKMADLQERARQLGVDVILQATDWRGVCAVYAWLTPDGRVLQANLSHLKKLSMAGAPAGDLARVAEVAIFASGSAEQSHAVLSGWAASVGIELTSAKWSGVDSDYSWRLPDGIPVTASLKKIRNCTRAVIRLRAADSQGGCITPEESRELVRRISASKSR